jgi:hypothetical protein
MQHAAAAVDVPDLQAPAMTIASRQTTSVPIYRLRRKRSVGTISLEDILLWFGRV